MGHWAKPEVDPDQTLIFYPTLRESLAADHPVHLTDEILRKYDWSRWEAEYVLVEGQPPIHPRHVAGAIAYGMTVGIRSSRRLEEACRSRLDFMLLLEGRTPDHTTVSIRPSGGVALGRSGAEVKSAVDCAEHSAPDMV